MAHPGDLARANTESWTTRDGVMWLITDMTDSHLTNTLKYLHRNVEGFRDRMLLEIASYPEPRGEMAMDAYDSGISQMEHAGPRETLTQAVKPYLNLEKEALKRKLPVVKELVLDEEEWPLG